MRSLELDRTVKTLLEPLAEVENNDFLCLEPINDLAAKQAIKELHGFSYFPIHEPWARVEIQSDMAVARMRNDRGWRTPPPNEEVQYISRSDTQKMAFSMLNLPWHPESYTITGAQQSLFMQLPLPVTKRLYPISYRLRDSIKLLSPGELDRRTLLEALQRALSRLDREAVPPAPKRSLLEALYRLDLVLSGLGNENDRRIVDQVAGILMITNLEFQELLHTSIRNLQEITRSDIQLDLQSTTLKVPSAFGIMQHFPVDMDQILPDGPRDYSREPHCCNSGGVKRRSALHDVPQLSGC